MSVAACWGGRPAVDGCGREGGLGWALREAWEGVSSVAALDAREANLLWPRTRSVTWGRQHPTAAARAPDAACES